MQPIKLWLSSIVVSTLIVSASAQTWDETAHGGGDAGHLPSTAQIIAGNPANPLLQITGNVAPDGDIDMYAILITDPASFTATTAFGTTWDTRLWLFRADGTGVLYNDDVGAPYYWTQSWIGAPFDVFSGNMLLGQWASWSTSNLTAGLYYLAVGAYERWALSSTNKIWQDFPFDVQRVPDGPDAAGAITSWGGTAWDYGDYTISLAGVSYVPEPSSLFMLSAGLAGLVRLRRRKQQFPQLFPIPTTRERGNNGGER